ncbi:MAG: hypothetical protein LUE61_07105 [Clostridiales bacterium]|nr:hypothetical protein [Clostridiales bacterium]
MKEFPFERAAMQNDPMPEGLTGAEQVLYQGLALVYARYHAGDIDRPTAQKEKLALMKTYDSIVFDCQLWARTAKLWGKLEGPLQRFRQKPTVETAKQAMELLYGVKMDWGDGR